LTMYESLSIARCSSRASSMRCVDKAGRCDKSQSNCSTWINGKEEIVN